MDINVGELIAGFRNYVVSPLNAFGMGGFVFDVEGEQVANLSAEITDHYTENNVAIQDHIAIKPKKITLKGYIGELIFTQSESNTAFLQSAVQKLSALDAYLPQLASAAEQIVDAVAVPSASDITLADATNIFGMVNNLINSAGDQGKQARGYAYFKSLMESKILMGVQTPWEFCTNMAIESVTAIQGEESVSVSDFSVTLKQIRVARTLTTAFGVSSAPEAANPNGNPAAQYQGVAAQQAAIPVQIGAVPGLTLPTSAITGGGREIVNVESLFDNNILGTVERNRR